MELILLTDFILIVFLEFQELNNLILCSFVIIYEKTLIHSSVSKIVNKNESEEVQKFSQEDNHEKSLEDIHTDNHGNSSAILPMYYKKGGKKTNV